MTDNRTTDLRELLDEQKLEWRRWTKSGQHGFTNVETTWFVPYSRVGCDEPGGFFAKARTSAHGLLHLKSLVVSPEQAIAATLGSGTCQVSYEQDGIPRCSNCQNVLYDEYKREDGGIKNFCDECGARIRKAGEDA